MAYTLLEVAVINAEYEVILNKLKELNFNKAKTAQALGIDNKTLYNKLKKHRKVTEFLKTEPVS